MNGKYLLLVEDNPDDVLLTERALKKCDGKVNLAVASDGREALDFLFSEVPNNKPAIILLDLKLPYLDGLEVLRRIRADERTKQLPVIMLTSSIDERDKKESLRLGANDFQSKPVNFDQFVELMRQICLAWLSD
jgi:two-component system, response regulator